ncbi:hypothetical protein PsorP6_006264 [Peronosclerospora sorghi]|uniref:Uncharacterized protein n=1 Tax=Peronosclerospora sorghi TaxID=230839 RepID=A0ACC0W6E8_9STRA|nr:hypothetical protein PsorP6_006264 [Peronosclerospora sorghi]
MTEAAAIYRPVLGETPSFRNSEYTRDIMENSRHTESGSQRESSMYGCGPHGQRPTEMKLLAVEPDFCAAPERKQDYKGRLRTWPGLLMILLIVAGAGVVITLSAIEVRNESRLNAARYENSARSRRKIKDGLDDDNVLVSDDGQVGNPKRYPDMGCELPDYQSKKGKIFAVSKNGTEVEVGIKGVNWFGMETVLAIPFGLWENMNNGTSVYEIAAFLARNKYNSVRLPVCVQHILTNTKPDHRLINVNTNRAINITSYITTIQSIVEALGYRHITVMISMHTLVPKESGGAWYSDQSGVSEKDFLSAIDILTKNLCNSKYWNILGIDLKNEPHECSWGGAAPDWQKGATLIGNRMLEGCPNWMAFVEGIASMGTVTLGTRELTYYDWWGGGLANAGGNPPALNVDNKLVWSPHYYNTGVSPSLYLYASGTQTAEGALKDYVELDDDTLRNNVEKTMHTMFGYLLTKDSNTAIVMGEFAGLYGKDLHPKLTTKRATDFTIEVMLKAGYAGGYMWSLNPESAYQYNPADTYGHFTEGLLEDDWLTPNKVFVEGIAALDSMKNLKMFPCFEVEQRRKVSPINVERASIQKGPSGNSTNANGCQYYSSKAAVDRSSQIPSTSISTSQKDAKREVKKQKEMKLLARTLFNQFLETGAWWGRIQERSLKCNTKEARWKIKNNLPDDQVLISDDGQVGNPKKYPDMGCELPDYQSKNGQIVAVSKNGTEVPVGIKGVNWFGMETGLAIPFGLWENMNNGTSLYEIAAFTSSTVSVCLCVSKTFSKTSRPISHSSI